MEALFGHKLHSTQICGQKGLVVGWNLCGLTILEYLHESREEPTMGWETVSPQEFAMIPCLLLLCQSILQFLFCKQDLCNLGSLVCVRARTLI